MLPRMRQETIVPDLPEQELVERARSGDRSAFDRLVGSNLPRVWRVVWRILRHREDTEDVVQEVFLAAYEALDGYRSEARFSTWLHRIAVTRALNHLDRAGEKLRRASNSFETPATADNRDRSVEPAALLADRAPSPLQSLEAKELLRRLCECLSRIPRAWRTILALREGEGLAYEEIAETLGIELGTVRSRLARARVALRACVEGEAS